MKPSQPSPRRQALGICVLATLASGSAHAQIQKAGDLLVDLNFSTLTPGDLLYIPNPGTLGGGFEAIGAVNTIPKIDKIPGNPTNSLYLDGSDFLISVTAATPMGGVPSRLNAAPGTVGPQPTRSVEAWVYNEVYPDEETVLAWGKRGGGEGTNFSCNYGANAGYGALGQWGAGPDLGWLSQPAAGQWHHLVWVSTGPGNGGSLAADSTQLYVDGIPDNTETYGASLNTHPGPILIGSQFDGDGTTPTGGLRGSMHIGKVRVHSGALTDAQVLNNYNFEKAGFPATTATALASGPIHRWSFSETAGTKATDSTGNYHGVVKGAGYTWTGGELQLPGIDGSANAAYVDLPNRLLSEHAPELRGSGDVTLEIWVTPTGLHNWSRCIDFGSAGGNELTGPGGGGEGFDYFMVTASNGTTDLISRLELRGIDPLGNGPGGAGGTLPDKLAIDFANPGLSLERHITVIWRNNAYMQVYEGSNLIATEARPGLRLEQFNDVNCWLGRSNFPADGNLEGTINEFRIYNRALSYGEVLKNDLDGPNATLPPVLDTDSDGLPDWFERKYAGPTMDYTVAGTPSQATLDGDADGLTNLQEFQRGTNAALPDSDGDGLADGAEITRGTEPLVVDSDGDGLTDGQEVNTHLTNPLAPDSDGDGYTDTQEVNAGSNPNNLTSIPVVFLASRFSFNNPAGPAASGSAIVDSVSGMTAYVRGNEATWAGTELTLPGGSSDFAAYVDLPNGSLSRFAKSKGGRGVVTVEGWMTIPNRGGAGWERIVDFGSSWPGLGRGEIFDIGRVATGNTSGMDYLAITGALGDDLANRRIEWNNNDRIGGLGNNVNVDFPSGANTMDVSFQFAMVVDENAGTMTYYQNGVQAATFNTLLKLDSLNDVNCWLGRSNWTGDQNLQGSYDEFRIYAGILSAGDVMKSFTKGPTTPADGTNPATDITTLKITNPNGWPEWWVDRNPTLPAPGSDTDGDGLTALQELGRGSDPAKADTDSDGLNDKVETATGVFVSATDTGSSPAVTDSDWDGLNDGQEIAVGSNPWDPDTDKDLAFDGNDDKPLDPAASTLPAAHRWPFNDLPELIAADTPSADVVGGAGFEAFIRGDNATSDGTSVYLPGGPNNNTVPYIDLPNGIISSQDAITVVGWLTIDGNSGGWNRFFDFGNSTNGEVPANAIGNGVDYFAYTAQRGGELNQQRFTVHKSGFGESLYDPNQATTVGDEIFYAATVDSSALDSSVYNLYRDGVWQLRSAGGAYPLSGLVDVNNWLGRSNYAGDTTLNGTYREFRIYNGVLNEQAVMALYAGGPDGVFQITSATFSGGSAKITFPTKIGLTYLVERSPDLTTWSAVESDILGDGADYTSSSPVPAATPRLYYRVRLDTPPG